MKYHVYLFERFNLGVLRARRDYERAPSRACLVNGCYGLHDDGYAMCRAHRRERKRDRWQGRMILTGASR